MALVVIGADPILGSEELAVVGATLANFREVCHSGEPKHPVRLADATELEVFAARIGCYARKAGEMPRGREKVDRHSSSKPIIVLITLMLYLRRVKRLTP